MPVADISRHLLDTRMRYATALMQQGRVLTDSCWNEMVQLEAEDQRQVIAETVCTNGTPNDGFLVGVPVPAAGVGTFPAGALVPVPFDTYDFAIGAGSFYLGGHRVTADNGETYLGQPDWLTQTLGAGKLPPLPTAAQLAAGPRTDLVFLRGWEQPVSSFEDQEFRERALGGPDTSVRLRRMRRVEVLPGVAAATCGDAAAELRTFLARPAAGDPGPATHAFDATGTELLSKARLTVDFDNGADGDPCRPVAQRGFLGAENQAIRVQLTSADRFIWGIDNAAPLYRVQLDPANPARIIFLTPPRDRATMPLVGQNVEILPWDAQLVNDEKVAAASGFISRIATTYDPDSKSLTIVAAVPPEMRSWLANLPAVVENPLDPATERRFFYLRVWTGGDPQPLFPAGGVMGNPVPLLGTGLTVSFSDFGLPGDFWIIAARPNTPELVVPWRLLHNAPPSGPRHFFTVLALVRWTLVGGAPSAAVHDCRERFRSLCRHNGCCTVIVGDGHDTHGDFTSIQAAIDSLPAEGGEVCVLRGHYNEAIRIDRGGITVHGCGHTTQIIPPAGAAIGVEIVDAPDIVIRDLAILHQPGIGVAITGRSRRVSLLRLAILARDHPAVVAKMESDLTIDGCTIGAAPLAAPLGAGSVVGLEPLVYVAGDNLQIERNSLVADESAGVRSTAPGGLQIGGGSNNVEIRRNRIRGGNGNGITLGSIRLVTAAEAADGGFMAEVSGSTGGTDVHTGFFVFDEDDCIHVPGDPDFPDGGGGPPPVPVSEGDLVDVRIIENRITGMGTNGIAVVKLAFPAHSADLIVIVDLLIRNNTIERCMRLGVGPIPAASIDAVAFGGIVLAEVERAVVRDNRIDDIGTAHRDPICGIFILMTLGIDIQRNQLHELGRMSNEADPLRLGNRGGIIIRTALPPVEPLPRRIAGRGDERLEGTPSVFIHGNVVVAREGRALFIDGLGTMIVTDNQLTAHGSDFIALLALLIAAETGSSGTEEIMLGAVGLAPVASSLGLLLRAIAGNAVVILNHGYSLEAYDTLTLATGGRRLYASRRWFVGGDVLFSDNQVLYDTLDPSFSFSLCAVLLFTFDNITLCSNAVNCDLDGDFVIVNTVAIGWSVEAVANRFKEHLFGCFLSAVTVGIALNATALNAGTHCIMHLGAIEPSAVVDLAAVGVAIPAPGIAPVQLRLNISLADPDGDNPDCRIFERALPATVGRWPQRMAVRI